MRFLIAPALASLVLAAPAFAAPAEQPVPVLNGDFAEPAMKGDGPTTVGIDNWTGANQRYSPTASGRTDNSHGVALQKDGNTLQQRLRGVRAGARVTVSYEDSPAVSKECLPADVADGQPYTVEATGGAVTDVTTAKDPGRVKGTPGGGRWTQRSYSFTASENEPLLTFTSKVTNSKAHITCSPMVARVRAVEVPPAVDQTVDRTSLGTSEAFKGNDKEKWLHNALAACNGENACEFRPDRRTSFRYYGQARVIGEAFVNCTRNTLQHTRVLSFAERSHDSVAQTYADAGQSLEEVARLPTSGDRTEDEKRLKSRPMAAQFALAYEKAWQRPWQWFSSDQRTVVEQIQPGEVSWVELQPTRERVEGWFVSRKDDYRLHAVVDGPSRAVPDRLLQRTGPMTGAEKQRCMAARPMTTTPVGVDAPASSSDKGLTGPSAPTAAGVRRIG
ncbi:carbohydrate binding domain-containing protein [Streptomyces sp. S6]